MKEFVLLGSIGLLFDMIGVILIFFFGMPPTLVRLVQGKLTLGEMTGEADEKISRKSRNYALFNFTGLCLIIGGFALQLLAGIYNYFTM